MSKKNLSVTGTIGLMLAMRMVVALYSTSTVFKYRTWTQLSTTRTVVIPVNCAFAFGAFVDLTIVLVFLYYLYQNRSLGLRQTRNIVSKIMHYSIATGAFTALFSITILIAYNAYSQSLLFAGVLEAVSKLYANSMLAMLNARHEIASKASTNGRNTIELSQLRWTAADAASHIEPGTSRLAIETIRISDEKQKMTLEPLRVA